MVNADTDCPAPPQHSPLNLVDFDKDYIRKPKAVPGTTGQQVYRNLLRDFRLGKECGDQTSIGCTLTVKYSDKYAVDPKKLNFHIVLDPTDCKPGETKIKEAYLAGPPEDKHTFVKLATAPGVIHHLELKKPQRDLLWTFYQSRIKAIAPTAKEARRNLLATKAIVAMDHVMGQILLHEAVHEKHLFEYWRLYMKALNAISIPNPISAPVGMDPILAARSAILAHVAKVETDLDKAIIDCTDRFHQRDSARGSYRDTLEACAFGANNTTLPAWEEACEAMEKGEDGKYHPSISFEGDFECENWPRY